MSASLSVSLLRKEYGPQIALRDVTFNLEEGDFTLLLGANGAGKSTLMRIIAQISRPTSGEVLFGGEKISAKIMRRSGFITHDPLLYASLTVLENLTLTCALLQRGSAELELQKWNLEPFRNKPVSELSRGVAFRAGLARALIHSPDYIFLDEPSASLDMNSAEILLSYLRERKKTGGASAIISTHDFSRLASIANRLLILRSGELVYDSRSACDELNSEKIGSLYLKYAH